VSFLIFIKKYFSFNRRERNGTIALLTIIIFLIISAVVLRSKNTPINISIEIPESDSNENKVDFERKNFEKNRKYKKYEDHSLAFIFDPNKISEEEAIQLGLSKKTAKTLINFRSKGGVFREKADLKKLYGVSDKLYSRLEDYILIEKKTTENEKVNKEHAVVIKNSPKIIDLNTADSIQLVSLNGIGPKLCARILSLRKSLGGFFETDQLFEVYGMKDSLFNLFSNRITVDIQNINKIKINSVTLIDLKKHAYLKYIIAQSIINYRDKHGKFKNEQDLLNVGSISQELMRKLSPYIEYD
jgi:competence protein ComEA